MLNKNDFMREYFKEGQNSTKELKGSNLYAAKGIVWNYRTVIGQIIGNTFYINSNKYSRTTSCNQSKLKNYATEYGYVIEEMQ